MIDIDEYIEMWDDNLLGSEGVQVLTNTLIAEVKRLQRTTEEDQRYITFLVNMLTPEQDCRWTHFVGGFCTWEECSHTEE
jgi:hypothetical protein